MADAWDVQPWPRRQLDRR